MKAAPEDQLRLLDLQVLDTRLDQVAHKRATLPEIAELAELAGKLAAVGDDIVRAQTQDGDLARDQARIESEVDLVASRAARDQTRLDAGQVSSPRELENLQHEIETLAKRRSELEDQVLVFMEQREEIQTRLAAALAEQAALADAQAGAQARLDDAIGTLDAQATSIRAGRGEHAAALPADLLALYEKVRASAGGIGAAALHRGQCQGCHLALSGGDLAVVKAAAPDDVVRCEECRRILVRTPESGL